MGNGVVKSHLVSTFIMKGRNNVSELNVNAIPAINAVDGFNPADFVRNTVKLAVQFTVKLERKKDVLLLQKQAVHQLVK